jgi:Spy/CpxP family protein refolding chaperone
MKRGLTITAIAVVMAVMILTVPALAQNKTKGNRTGGSYPSNCPWNNSTLDLTENQQQKLTDLQKKNVESGSKIMTEMQLKRVELQGLYRTEKPDFAKIDKANKEIRDLRDKRYELQKDFRNDARKLLTKKQLEDNPYAFSGRGRGNGMGHGKGGGGSKGGGGGSGRW